MGKSIQLHGFPYLVSAEVVKEFLERHTGKGTVYALEVWMSKKSGNSRACAKVQFTTTSAADYIISLASKRLWYGSSSYLRAWPMDKEIVQKPKTYLHNMEDITLYFGCQISKEKYLVLWKSDDDVTVRFGFGMRKIYFFLSFSSVDYKLQLSYENIWQVTKYCPPHSQKENFLLIQLVGAPRIFKKLGVSAFSYFEDTPEDQWCRTTDFTPSGCIGQSSTLCLKIPYYVPLPNFADNFAYYQEVKTSNFSLERGASFSCNLDLVPIVAPPPRIVLPYNILFKICSLVQHGCLPGPSLDIEFFSWLVDQLRKNAAFVENALEKLFHLKECCYEPVKWLKEQRGNRRFPQTPAINVGDGLVYVRRVQVTPCKVYFCGPEVNMSNRVLRHYSKYIDSFLRVSFIDEELDKLFSTDLSPRVSSGNEKKRTALFDRILTTLRNGVVIGGQKFEFLAFSSSQLRDNSAWLFASRDDGLTAAHIRAWMGNFDEIRNVAKYAARLGQSFGSSTETSSVSKHDVEIIPDIEVESGGNKYVFSDGIGKISEDFAEIVAKKCCPNGSKPSAFQIRYGGYKGVVAVDRMSTKKLSLRKSMSKYESENIKLDVLAWSKYQPCFLNRQIISLLSTLGVNDHVFENKQREAVDQLDAILTDPVRAQEALELMSPGENTNILREMLLCGYKPNTEPFLSMMLQNFRASKLMELRIKARIFIPSGRSLMGCLDETRALEYGEVFVQISEAGNRRLHDDSSLRSYKKGTFVVEGKVVVAKNPCLHPGDVRVLKAVYIHDLRHMVDCVVFPQKGKRPHPNECSGSDLDGDIYFVCWDPDLIPPHQFQPMDYTPAPTIQLDHVVTIEEVQEYFTNYIVNDSLGVIANAHTVFADREPRKAFSDPCLALAKLFSIAVDFPKTGVPAEIPAHLRVKEYPDFMDKADKTTYDSTRVLGKLFREVKNILPTKWSIKSFTKEVAMHSYDPDMEVDGFEDFVNDAYNYKEEYDFKLGNLMDYYGIKTEAEILSGSIMKMSKSFDRRRDAESIGLAMKSLRKEARTWFNKKNDADDDVYAKASAWYYVTYHPNYWGCYNEGLKRDHFLSFPWTVYDKLIHIKKDKASIKRALRLSSLQRQFSSGLRLS